MLFSVIIPFLLAFVASFLGSLQPGSVNVSVFETALRRNFRTAVWLGLGGALPEVIYGMLAFYSLENLNTIQGFSFYFNILSLLIFAGVIINLFIPKKKSNKAPQNPELPIKNTQNVFWYGFLLGLFNPILLVFWILTIQYFYQFGWIEVESWVVQISFSLGAVFGAWVLLILVAYLADNKHFSINNWRIFRFLQSAKS
ncbi:MAG: LysE family transporter [Microscillaceae bacterium]|jgi:threonine/homoserine/homoserine lactone efflux protein|nr:LysE family transporter [Microscillaceae bacterium]